MDFENKIFTIPNILTFIRIGLIPIFVISYFLWDNYFVTGILVVLSALTDVLDGFIARTFRMTSKLGRMLDPFADKLTQLTLALCIGIKFRYLFIAFGLLAIRDLFMFITGVIIVNKYNETFCALWYGKVATAVTYSCMLLHLFFPEAPELLLIIFAIASISCIALSFILYSIHNLKLINKLKHNK